MDEKKKIPKMMELLFGEAVRQLVVEAEHAIDLQQIQSIENHNK